MKKFFFLAAIFGFAATLNAQTVPYDGFGVTLKPHLFVVDSVVEERLGVIVVQFRSSEFPVVISVNGQDITIVEAESHIGFHTFYANPVLGEEGPYRRSYVVDIRSPRAYIYHPVTLSAPPRRPL